METKSFKYCEKAGTSFSAASPFYIADKCSPLSLLFRIISGSCLITNRYTDEAVELSKNYFFQDFQLNKDNDLSFLDTFEEGLTCADYDNHIKKFGFKNRKFYLALLNEISGCIFCEEKERHTTAFIHLYRAYEHLAYAFPMIYASKSDNFIDSFGKLRDWLDPKSTNNKVGELKFHSNFLSSLYKGATELESSIDINIIAKDEFKKIIFDGIAKKVMEWKTPEQYTSTTYAPDKLSIRFKEFHVFIVSLRNRFFHYSNSHPNNIGLDDIIDPELLFSFINKPALYFIAKLFHGVTTHQLR